MFEKERDIPYKVEAEAALLRRIISTHKNITLIQDDYRKRLAGIKGEKELDYQLSFIKKGSYAILNDLRLKVNNHFFQIDSLLISTKLLIIVDSKNISGTLIFDYSFNQFIRIYNEKEAGMKDPITQVRRQASQLAQWLKEQKLNSPPIEHLIVVTNPSAIIKSLGSNSRENRRTIHSELLVERITEIEMPYIKEVITMKEVKKMCESLIKSHSPLIPDILKTFDIPPSDIKKGVHCPKCSYIPLERGFGTWLCPICMHKFKNAHLYTLRDYLLIFGPEISLNEFCTFLLFPISKRKAASYLLVSMKLPHKGTKKGRVYDLSPLYQIKTPNSNQSQ